MVYSNTESYLNYKFEDLEVYYSNTDKEYKETLIENKFPKDAANELVRTSYACGIWDTNKIFLNNQGYLYKSKKKYFVMN